MEMLDMRIGFAVSR